MFSGKAFSDQMGLLINNYVAEILHLLINTEELPKNPQNFQRYKTVLTDGDLSPADIFSDPTKTAVCRCSIE